MNIRNVTPNKKPNIPTSSDVGRQDRVRQVTLTQIYNLNEDEESSVEECEYYGGAYEHWNLWEILWWTVRSGRTGDVYDG